VWRGIRRNVAHAVQRLCPENDIGDLVYSAILFREIHGYFPSFRGAPRSLNDAIFRLKFRERDNHLRATAIDKEYGKMLVNGILGPEFSPRVFGVLRSRDEILDFEFPDRCVIKPTHSSGLVKFRKNGEAINRDEVIGWLTSGDQYQMGRDKKYKNLAKKVIVEEFLDFGDGVPEDYKVFCTGGQAKIVQHDMARFQGHSRRWYTADWKTLPFAAGFPPGEIRPAPANLDKMITAAEAIGKHFSFARVDLYSDGRDRIVVGEISSLPGGGHEPMVPREIDFELAGLIADPDFDPARWAS